MVTHGQEEDWQFKSCLCTAKEILIRLITRSVTKLFHFIYVQKPLLLKEMGLFYWCCLEMLILDFRFKG